MCKKWFLLFRTRWTICNGLVRKMPKTEYGNSARLSLIALKFSAISSGFFFHPLAKYVASRLFFMNAASRYVKP